MYALLNDLRRAGKPAIGLAVALCAVLLTGIVVSATQAQSSHRRTAAAGPNGWVQVTDLKVGFTARLPERPADSRLASVSADGTHFKVRLATAGQRIVIERFAVPEVSASMLSAIFRSAIDSLASGAGFQVESEGDTTFRGQLARLGVYVTDSGTRYKAMIFVAGAENLYLIAAPARDFRPITTSFQAR